MTKDLTAAKRYAKALYDASKEQGIVDQAVSEMREVSSVFSDPELLLVLTHPNIDASAKTKLIRSAFEGKVSVIVLHSLLLLMERKRAELIPAVYEQFARIADESSGRAEAVVHSPKELTAQEAAAIEAKFTAITGKTIHVTNFVDASLLGGVKVRIGDKLYDGSLSGKLKRLDKVLQTSQAL